MSTSSAPRALAAVRLAAAAALVLAGCSEGGGGGPTAPDPPAPVPAVPIALSAASPTLDRGESGTIAVTFTRDGVEVDDEGGIVPCSGRGAAARHATPGPDRRPRWPAPCAVVPDGRAPHGAAPGARNRRRRTWRRSP